VEIEVKFRLSDQMEANIQALCANKGYTLETQRDVYFQTPAGGPALRIRDSGLGACVTLKNKFSEVNGVRTRVEIEPTVVPGEIEDWIRVFGELGFPAGTIVNKTRCSFALERGVTICLDNIAGVGKFIEFEVIGSPEDPTVIERLERTIRNYGFALEPRVTESYRELVEAAAV
jgi:predicted adenylyl cyclase CyaB